MLRIYIYNLEGAAEEEEDVFTMFRVKGAGIPKVGPITVIMEVNDKAVTLEVDTGCSVTLVNQAE